MFLSSIERYDFLTGRNPFNSWKIVHGAPRTRGEVASQLIYGKSIIYRNADDEFLPSWRRDISSSCSNWERASSGDFGLEDDRPILSWNILHGFSSSCITVKNWWPILYPRQIEEIAPFRIRIYPPVLVVIVCQHCWRWWQFWSSNKVSSQTG